MKPSPWAIVWLTCLATEVVALDATVRLKTFGTGAFLPSHDVQRALMGTPAVDFGADVRVVARHERGRLQFMVDHATTLLSGDSLALARAPQTSLDQTPSDDDRRLMDLTFEVTDGSRHRVLHRLDRFAVRYRGKRWTATAGRDAVSWGNGLVFSPMDLMSPFAPTVVDQDYKAGDDLLLLERLSGRGGDFQFLAVGRRGSAGSRAASHGSLAAKWHAFVGQSEVEVLVARHFRDRVLALSGQWPLGGAMVRSDLVMTKVRGGDVKVSGVLNLDYSVVVGEEPVYLFFEYYRNGFGVATLDGARALPTPLRARLERGEVFNMMRDYAAVGLAWQWHPLLSQSLTLLGNLHDGSALVQTSVTYDAGDAARLQLGITSTLGRAGDEFGGVPAAGGPLTVGGGMRLFFRWLYYR